MVLSLLFENSKISSYFSNPFVMSIRLDHDDYDDHDDPYGYETLYNELYLYEPLLINPNVFNLQVHNILFQSQLIGGKNMYRTVFRNKF